MSKPADAHARRKALKAIVAGSGAVAAVKAGKESWSKPMVDSVLVPAHAVSSPGGTA